MSFSPVHDEAGALRAVALVGLDVTESRQIEEDLRRSEERYRSLVEAQSQLVWITSPTGTVVEDAPQWRAITGQGLEEYLAYGWLEAVHPDERRHTEEAWREALRGRTMFEWNYRVRTRASGYRHFEVRAVPIIRHGRVVEWVGANTDVTPQREAEEMRGRLTDQLGAAALRTARLQGATAQLAEALTVEQVVQVIIDVGRTALAADRSAVALLDTDRAALKLINSEGIPEASGSSGEEIPLSHSSVMTMAVNSRRPVFAESPVSLRCSCSSGRRQGGARPATWPTATSGPGWACRCWPRAGRWARCASRSPGRRRSPRRTGSSWRRWPGSARWRWSGPRCSSASTAPPRRCSAACCPTACRWSRAWSWPSGSAPAAATCRSAATGTTRSCCRTAGSRPSSATSWARASRRRPGMGRIRNAMRALALTNPPPAAVLTGLDRVFEATEEEEQVTTLAYMVVEPGTGEGTLALAGHPPPRAGLPAGHGDSVRRRAGHAAGLADQPPAVPVRGAARPHRRALLRRTGGEPQARAGRRTRRDLQVVTEAPPEVVGIRTCCWTSWLTGCCRDMNRMMTLPPWRFTCRLPRRVTE